MTMVGQTLSPPGHFGEAPLRSIPADAVDRPLAGFQRDYVDGETVPRHAHSRAPLPDATPGAMRIATDAVGFIVPPGRALWLPAMRAPFLRAAAAVGYASAAAFGATPGAGRARGPDAWPGGRWQRRRNDGQEGLNQLCVQYTPVS